ncbi:MAG: hypothetical protein ACLFWH_05275 [Actinomycetota bacterium]
MRRRAYPFTAPARVTPESVVGVVVTVDPISVDMPTRVRVERQLAGALKVLGMEIVPVEKASRPWWRRKTNRGGSQ